MSPSPPSPSSSRSRPLLRFRTPVSPPSTPPSRSSLFPSPRDLATRLRPRLSPDRRPRRNAFKETLLKFPEHDTGTVAALVQHYDGDLDQVNAALGRQRLQDGTSPRIASPDRQATPLGPPIAGRLRGKRGKENQDGQGMPSTPWTSGEIDLGTGGKVTRKNSREQEGSEDSRSRFDALAEGWKMEQSKQNARKRWEDVGGKAFSVGTTGGPQSDSGVRWTRILNDNGSERDSVISGGSERLAGMKRRRSSGVEKVDESEGISGVRNTEGSSSASAGLFGSESVVRGAKGVEYERLVAKVEMLEGVLGELCRENEIMREELEKRVEMGHVELGGLERRHEALRVEVEENLKRGVHTEKYLDVMRRDLLQAIGRREGRVAVWIRSSVSNVFYYVLAYGVPVLAWGIRGIRDAVSALKRSWRRWSEV